MNTPLEQKNRALPAQMMNVITLSGFGEGNFQALFESMERDQLNRGAIEGQHES